MKIPPQAQRVFAGKIFDVYQWPETLYDGTTATFEGIKRVDSVQVIALKGQKVVIGDEQQPDREPFTSLFGGRCEAGEDPLAAAKRELREESGLESDEWHLMGSYNNSGRVDWTIHYFVARHCRKVGKQQLDAGEKITVRSVSFRQFIAELQTPAFRGGDRHLEMIGIKPDPKKVKAFRETLWPKK